MSSKTTETRTRILQTTLSVLAETNGKTVTMVTIAKRAELSRQAIYLHFSTRSKLLEAASSHLDDKLKLNRLLKPFRKAKTGRQRLARYIEFWGNYVAQTQGISKALLMAQDTDATAADTWKARMSALRDGCRAVIDGLDAEGSLAKGWTRKTATDVLWTLLSLPAWEMYSGECGWTTQEYVKRLKKMARKTLIKR